MSSAPTTAVLRNKGIAVTVHKRDAQGKLRFTDEDEPEVEQRYVRFSINVMAQLETAYRGRTITMPDGTVRHINGYTAWQELLRIEPVTTVRSILSLMWELPEETVGEIMLLTELPEYAAAVAAAFAIAEGVDPQQATRVIRQRVEAAVAEDLNKYPIPNGDSPD